MVQQTLKERVNAGGPVVGWSGVREESQFARAVDEGIDFVFVDSQHSPFSEGGLVEYCQRAATYELPVHFRINHTRSAYLIGTYLDLGPAGVEVPQVEQRATVTEALEAFYYPAQGKRSYGGGARWGVGDFPDFNDYGRWWNKNGILWMQVESVEATTNAYALAQSGIDCLSFGPTDLTVSLGLHQHPLLQTVDDCVRYVVRAIEPTGTVVCFRIGSPADRAKYADMGVAVFLEGAPA